tara:strand:+ start:112 stop:522 length:411 start_codon:yes stop_codon:yes gene_type:complete
MYNKNFNKMEKNPNLVETQMWFLGTYTNNNGRTMLEFSEKKVSPTEYEKVKKHNENIRNNESITVNFEGIQLESYGSFQQCDTGDVVIIPLKNKVNFTKEQLKKFRSKKHTVLKGRPVKYSSGNESSFRHLGKFKV